MIAMRGLAIQNDKINVHGAATALGHPMARAARLLVILLSALETHHGQKGVALCVAATAMAVELVGYRQAYPVSESGPS